MRSIDEIIQAVAHIQGVSVEELLAARNEGSVYSDGLCWMLTNKGRARLTDLVVDGREFDTVYVPVDNPDPDPVSAKDTQIGGDHYKKLGAYQPWEVLANWLTPEELRGYAKGTAITYFAREQDKGGDQDIAKGIHTLQLWQELRKDK